MATQKRSKDLPKHFQKVKTELDKAINTYWFNKQKDGKREESKENLGLLYLMLGENAEQAQKHHYLIGEKLMGLMQENEVIYLHDYGLALEFDTEAQWLFSREITGQEWKDYDLKSNAEYLKSKK